MRSSKNKTRAATRAAGRRRLTLLVLAALALALATTIATASAQQEIELQVDECSDDAADCKSSQTIQVEPAPAPAPPAQETHEYDLQSGEGTVTSDGEVDKETLDVDLSAGPEDGDGHDHADHGGAEAKDGPLPGSNDVGMAPVTTTGGSGFAGFGADFLSGDEALSRFAVPPFLIPIYIAAGQAYDVPWNVLASINQIETDFGRIGQQVSYAGALGWMQFMPGTWRAYGVDASGDGIADPFNPVDAIYAAARYLSANGASDDLRRAIFAYNHADWYVDRVLQTASVYGSLPGGLVAETGSLAFGRFPLKGRVSYADDFRRAQVEGDKPKGLWIDGRPNARAVATQNVKVVEIQLDRTLAEPFRDGAALAERGVQAQRQVEAPRNRRTDMPKGYGIAPVPGVGVVVEDKLGNRYAYSGLERIETGIKPGVRLRGGDTLGRVGSDDSRMLFGARAAGGAPVDPRPLVDGYRLQEAADFYHAIAPLADNPFVLAEDEALAGVSGSARELASRVLNASGIYIYPGGQEDIRNGVVDKRVLGALLYLRRNGLELTITSLRSGHSFYTSGGGVSAHSFGAAVDIAAFNGQSVLGHQGPGSLTEQAIKLLMRLQGSAQPAQLISLMNLGGPSFAMGDHDDHLHVGYSFQPSLGSGRSGDVLGQVDFDGGASLLDSGPVDRSLEQKLSGKLGAIENPSVSRDQGAGALHVEAEAPFDQTQAAGRGGSGPLALHPAAAGSRLADVDVPAEGEAWGIGTVDGTGQPDWAAEQTVVTRFAHGVWEVVGAPVDARGRVVNPDLRALAVLPGGSGYAVGDDGAVVELRGERAPRLLESATEGRLHAVDADGDGRSVRGFAVGAEGAVVRLTGARTAAERAGSSDLRGVLVDGDGALAAGGTGSGALMRRDADGWTPAGVDFGLPEGMRARLTALDRSGGELWVAGSVADSTGTAAAELPFAATRVGDGWRTYCAGRPALAAIAELGTPTARRVCSAGLTNDPFDTGAAADIAVTGLGAVVATARGLQVESQQGFQAAVGDPREYVHLALGPSGRGWATGVDGALSVVRRTDEGDTSDVDTLPLTRGGGLSSIAQSPSGDRLIAVGSGEAAIREDGSWTPLTAAPVGLVAAGFTGDEVWATTETGTLLRLDGGRWAASNSGLTGDNGSLTTLAHALGGDLISRGVSGGAGEPASFAFSNAGMGVAGTDSGQVLRYGGQGWRLEDTPAAVPIAAVAAGDDVTVAAGAQGVLVEDAGDGWTAPDEPRDLAAGRAFTAADALDDGTVVAVAGGKVLERPGDGAWALSELGPLGVPARRVAGYRSGDELRVVALVGDEGQLGLLDGGADGWRVLDLPAGMQIVDFALDEGSQRVSLIGYRDAEPIALEMELDAR